MAPFLDSNIIVYAYSTGAKAVRAQHFLGSDFIISTQVLNEFANVSRAKQKFEWAVISEAIGILVQTARDVIILTPSMSLDAITLAERYEVHVYDALIVAAALHAECDTLYSEDMHDGLVIERRLTIRNPFA